MTKTFPMGPVCQVFPVDLIYYKSIEIFVRKEIKLKNRSFRFSHNNSIS